MKTAVLQLSCAVLVAAMVAATVRDFHSAARSRRPVITPSSAAAPEIAEMQQRIRIKNDIARRVIEQRIPLPEAIKLFDTVNGGDGTANVILFLPGRSMRERLCHQVILYVRSVESEMERGGHVWSDPRASDELQADFDRRLAAGEFPPEPDAQ